MKASWHPVGARVSYAALPPLGATIGLAHRAWRVVSIEPLDPDDWLEQDHGAWERHGREVPWRLAPVRVSLVEVKGGKTRGARHETVARPWVGGEWYLLGEHYAICASCGEVCPCRHVEAERAERVRAQRIAQILSIPSGSCLACGAIVTGRQRSISFEGENLISLDGPPAMFHLRRACRDDAIAYERKWVAQHPWRRARLSCRGHCVRHVRGDVCSEADCPGGDARHASWERCTASDCADAHHGETGRLGGTDGAPIGPSMRQGLRSVRGGDGRP